MSAFTRPPLSPSALAAKTICMYVCVCVLTESFHPDLRVARGFYVFLPFGLLLQFDVFIDTGLSRFDYFLAFSLPFSLSLSLSLYLCVSRHCHRTRLASCIMFYFYVTVCFPRPGSGGTESPRFFLGGRWREVDGREAHERATAVRLWWEEKTHTHTHTHTFRATECRKKGSKRYKHKPWGSNEPGRELRENVAPSPFP